VDKLIGSSEMRRVARILACFLVTLLSLRALPAEAQVSFDIIGVRALGMGGAFVAVADDATAAYWNPAGLLGGPPAGVTIGWDRFHFRDQGAPPAAGAGRLSARSIAVGTWPVGISIARINAAGIRADGQGHLVAESLRSTQVGFTVLHSITEYAVVGATVKYIRGTAGFGAADADSVEAVLDGVLGTSADSHGAIDVDVSVAAGSERFRAAVAFKNLRRPGFATLGGKAIYLERRARVGIAALPRDGLTLAIDVDLDTADPLVGLRRTIALGGETRIGERLALRGGIRLQQSGDSRPIGALGGSVRLRLGLWLDGYVTRGHSAGDRGFGIALRAGT
jgi:hypothetical protein